MRPLAVFAALLVASSVATARPAGYFGFGEPPSYLQLSRYLREQLYVSESDSFAISLPIPACRERGFARRDICGYKFCVEARGVVSEVWLVQRFGYQENPEGACKSGFQPWLGDPPIAVAEFCDFQPKNEQCKSGQREGLKPLSLYESTGAAVLAREHAERVAKLSAEANAEEAKREEARLLLAAAAKAREQREQLIARIKAEGAVRAYPKLATFRYKECQEAANVLLTIESRDSPMYLEGLQSLEQCAASAESELGAEVRQALAKASARVAEPIKDLHAYTVASLRALTNFHQSVIEARQARADRMSGIDERATRLDLEL